MTDGDGLRPDEPLLAVQDLSRHYPVTEGVFDRQVGTVRAVDGVSFTLRRGETLGLVGESGCGKSTVATTALGLEEPTGGDVRFEGRSVPEMDAAALERFRRDAQLIFQDPTSSFDPRMTVGESVTEPLLVHGLGDRTRRRAIGTDLLERVGLEAGDYDRYPHEFSGGQKQRVAIARALSVNPQLLVADEPVSALDVSVKSAILSLLSELQAELGLSVIFISHDLGVVREIADRVAVMYLGEVVEIAPTDRLFTDPKHPYTEALVAAIPEPDPDRERSGGDGQLRGSVPSASDPPDGCRFHTRCPAVIQPDDVDVAQPVWRRLLRARRRIEAGDVDLEAVRDLRAGAARADATADSTRRGLSAALRDEFGLPETLSDPDAERTLAEALDSLAAGRPDAAVATMTELFTTPCERSAPELRSVDDDRDRHVACFLHHPPGE